MKKKINWVQLIRHMVQILGLIYRLRGKPAVTAEEADMFTDVGEYEIVEL